MKTKAPLALIAGFLLAAMSGSLLAADKFVDVGKGEYNAACASCHGLKGLGDGPAAELMKAKAPDITLLVKGNNGVFPFDRVYQIIDGRQEIKSHGSREMPIWGTAFRRQSSLYFDSYPVIDPEASARSRILALTEYVYRMQNK
jgi:mono/diheme cytochrome c family protein